MAGGCAADGPYALTTAVWLSWNFRSRKSVRTVEWRNWPCPKRMMTKGAILRTSRSITLTVKKCHQSLTITNTRLEIQGRHRCPTQTASLSTNLSSCQTVVNRLLDRVRCCLEQGRSKRLAMASSMSLISRAPAILASQSNYSSASEQFLYCSF